MKTPLTEDHLVKYGFELDDCDEGICYWSKNGIHIYGLEKAPDEFLYDDKIIETVEDLKEIFSKRGIELKIEEDIRF